MLAVCIAAATAAHPTILLRHWSRCKVDIHTPPIAGEAFVTQIWICGFHADGCIFSREMTFVRLVIFMSLDFQGVAALQVAFVVNLCLWHYFLYVFPLLSLLTCVTAAACMLDRKQVAVMVLVVSHLWQSI